METTDPLLSDLDAAEAHLHRAVQRAQAEDLDEPAKAIEHTIDTINHDREEIGRWRAVYGDAA